MRFWRKKGETDIVRGSRIKPEESPVVAINAQECAVPALFPDARHPHYVFALVGIQLESRIEIEREVGKLYVCV